MLKFTCIYIVRQGVSLSGDDAVGLVGMGAINDTGTDLAHPAARKLDGVVGISQLSEGVFLLKGCHGCHVECTGLGFKQTNDTCTRVGISINDTCTRAVVLIGRGLLQIMPVSRLADAP
jgi:hypothetical protein